MEMQWIKLSDKLPIPGQDLLIWDGSVRGRGYLRKDNQWMTVSFEGEHEPTHRIITHWMLLPNPPQNDTAG